MNSSSACQHPEKIKWKVKLSARGHLDYLFEETYEGLEINNNSDGTTEVEGMLDDLPEVYGFIIRLRDAVVFLQSLQVSRIEIESAAISNIKEEL